MLGYKQMNRSSSFRLASEGYGSPQRKFHLSSYISRPSEKIYYTIVNIVVLRFIGCPRCARGMPKTSVGIIVHK